MPKLLTAYAFPPLCPGAHLRCPALPRLQLFINGQWVDAASGKTFKVLDPRTEEVIAEVGWLKPGW